MPTFCFPLYFLLFIIFSSHTFTLNFFVCPILRFTFLCSILSFHSFANSHFPCVPFFILTSAPFHLSSFYTISLFFTLLFFSSYSFTAPIFCPVPSSHFSSCYPLIPSPLVFSSSFLNPPPPPPHRLPGNSVWSSSSGGSSGGSARLR